MADRNTDLNLIKGIGINNRNIPPYWKIEQQNFGGNLRRGLDQAMAYGSYKNLPSALVGFIFAAPCLFFTYYTVRLIYVNLAASAEEAAAHRTGGMLIGAIAFPVAAIIFGIISWFCFRKARRGFTQK